MNCDNAEWATIKKKPARTYRTLMNNHATQYYKMFFIDMKSETIFF